MSATRYLNELIDYGGIPTTRAEAILDMQRIGTDQEMIDRWLQATNTPDACEPSRHNHHRHLRRRPNSRTPKASHS